MGWIAARDPGGRVRAVPNQTPGLLEQVGLTREQVDSAAWTVEPSGRKAEGAAAINRVFEALGGFWGLVSRAYHLPPVRLLEDRIYAWVVVNRSRIPVALWPFR